MKITISILSLTTGLCCLLFLSCKKAVILTTDCFPNASTFRQIVDKPATVSQQSAGIFFIVEKGTIDTRLNPCNLPADFQVDNLQVVVSGNVKTTIGGTGPCCTEDFVITKISN